jgi:Tfp pilus assembly protein PilX
MISTGTQHDNTDNREHGTGLAMAMLCLAVLTLLGIAGMQSARLELLITDNRRQQSTALANTEYVLGVGEQAVLQLRTNPFHPDMAGDPFYPTGMRDLDPGTPHVVERPTNRIWTFGRATVWLPDIDGNGNVDDGSGEYLVEDAGLYTASGEDVSVSGILRPLPGARMQAFRITAHSTRAHGAHRAVQSLVTREPLPR